MKMVIDADAHANEPNDLFDRYLEKEFKEQGPKVVQIGQVQYWMVEGKLLPRPVGTFGHGTPNGYLFKKGKPDMAINSPGLDDVQGRLKDLDKEGIDVQVAYPNIMAMASHLDDGDLAAAMCRAYNNYTAEKSKPFNGRVKGIAAVALQKPDEAAKRDQRSGPGRHGGHGKRSGSGISTIRISNRFFAKPTISAQRWAFIGSLAVSIARVKNVLKTRIFISIWSVCRLT